MLFRAFQFLLMVSIPQMGSGQSGLEQNWPRWRGPAATGYAADARPPTNWSASENVRWKTALPGRGHSAPIVWGQHVFLTTAIPIGEKLPPRPSGRPGEHDNLPVDSKYQFVVISLARDSGRVLWQQVVREAVPVEGGHASASLASASIVTDGEMLFAFFGSQGLYGLDFEGKVIWSRDFGQMHSKHGHGEGASPTLYGDTLIVNWDHEEQSFLTALDKRTGETLWHQDRDEVTSWSTPVIVESDGDTQVVVAGTARVRSYDLTTGRILWECGGMSANIVATPVFAEGVLIVGSSYEKRIMMAIDVKNARGDITESDHILWTRSRGTPYVPSMLLVDDGVYFLAHYQNILTRVDLMTGKESPGAMRLGDLTSIYASPVAAGEHIYVTDLVGTTMVITKGSEPSLVAVNRLNEDVNASLAIADEEIFIRGLKHLYCIGGR